MIAVMVSIAVMMLTVLVSFPRGISRRNSVAALPVMPVVVIIIAAMEMPGRIVVLSVVVVPRLVDIGVASRHGDHMVVMHVFDLTTC
jgi:hypothetical protein